MNENDSQPQADPSDVIAGHMPDRGTLPPWQDHASDPRNAVPGEGGFRAVAWQGEPTLAAIAARVTALEAWRDDQVSDDRNEPCETGPEEKGPTPPTVGEFLAEARHDRRNRADAMLGTAETVRATGGAAEIAGVRLEACDEYGRTETTERLDRAISERDKHERAAKNAAREISAMLEKLDKARAERDQARKELAAALAPVGTESAEKDADRDEVVKVTVVCGEQRLADVGYGRTALVTCDRTAGHTGIHFADPRQAVTW